VLDFAVPLVTPGLVARLALVADLDSAVLQVSVALLEPRDSVVLRETLGRVVLRDQLDSVEQPAVQGRAVRRAFVEVQAFAEHLAARDSVVLQARAELLE
jgi:hypothetical protein